MIFVWVQEEKKNQLNKLDQSKMLDQRKELDLDLVLEHLERNIWIWFCKLSIWN